MKNAFLVIAILVLGAVTNAADNTSQDPVVKPANTIDRANGKALINSIKFDYWIEDRGWGVSYDGTLLVAEKSFLFNYQPSTPTKDDLQTSTMLGVDASDKCSQLGQLEYPAQAKALPANMKAVLKTEIVSPYGFDEGDIGFYERFVCLVTISSQKTN